jgi:hypothetical protein
VDLETFKNDWDVRIPCPYLFCWSMLTVPVGSTPGHRTDPNWSTFNRHRTFSRRSNE